LIRASFYAININADHLLYYLPVNVLSLHLPGVDEIGFPAAFSMAFSMPSSSPFAFS